MSTKKISIDLLLAELVSLKQEYLKTKLEVKEKQDAVKFAKERLKVLGMQVGVMKWKTRIAKAK